MTDPAQDEGESPGIDPRLLTALTTEHFTLQGARAATISESSSRSTIFIGAVSSALVALGFVAQVSDAGSVFRVFAFTALPALVILGLFTWARVLENGVEDFVYARAINRIRHVYLEIDPARRDLFLLSAHDDHAGVLANMGLERRRGQILYTSGTVIAVINGFLAGVTAGLAVDAAASASLAVAVAGGAIAGGGLVAVLLGASWRGWGRGAGPDDRVLFPSPDSSSDAQPPSNAAPPSSTST